MRKIIFFIIIGILFILFLKTAFQVHADVGPDDIYGRDPRNGDWVPLGRGWGCGNGICGDGFYDGYHGGICSNNCDNTPDGNEGGMEGGGGGSGGNPWRFNCPALGCNGYCAGGCTVERECTDADNGNPGCEFLKKMMQTVFPPIRFTKGQQEA